MKSFPPYIRNFSQVVQKWGGGSELRTTQKFFYMSKTMHLANTSKFDRYLARGILGCVLALTFSAALASTDNNTPTGEDKTTYLDRQLEISANALRNDPNDKKRWLSNAIYSSSRKPETLSLKLIHATGFKMTMQPIPGYLVFERNGKQDVFQIGVAAGTKNNVCPEYSLRVLYADAGYALFKKSCLGYEYGFDGKKDHFHAGIDYLLYDASTATIAVLWSNSSSEKGGAYPAPDIKPTIKKLRDGYELDWRFVNPVSKEKLHVHTTYMPTKIDGKLQLLCTDLNAPKGEEHDVNCEYGILPKISK